MSYPVRIPVCFDTPTSDNKKTSAINRWLRTRKIWVKRSHPNAPGQGTDDRWVKIGFDYIEIKNPDLIVGRRGKGLRVYPGDANVYTFGCEDDATLFKLFFG